MTSRGLTCWTLGAALATSGCVLSDFEIGASDAGSDGGPLQCAYCGEVLADLPAGYWRLGEASGAVAADSSQNGRNGTYINGVVLGSVGALAIDSDTSASFDGVDDFVAIPHFGGAWNTGTSDFSFEAWINPASDVGHGIASYFFYTGLGTTNHQGWEIKLAGPIDFHSNGLYLCARVYSTTSQQQTCFLNQALLPGVFTHVVVVVDRAASEVYLYLNGALAESVNLIVQGSLDPDGITRSLTLGDKLVGTPQKLHGQLDEAAFYHSALSAARVKAHYDLSRRSR